MKKDTPENCCGHEPIHKCHPHAGGPSNAVYGLGVVGALFYFLSNATGFGAVLLGIGKAIIWPALLIYKMLSYFQI